MFSLNNDCVRLICSHLSLYDVIKASRASKAICKLFENYLNQHPLLQSKSFFDKPPSLKVLKRVNRALQPFPKPLPHPDFESASKVEVTPNYLLAFYTGKNAYLKVHAKSFFGKWTLLRTIKAPKLNHFICRDSLLIYYDSHRIVVDTPAGRTPPSLVPYNSRYPVLNSKNAYCYATADKTVVVTDKSREINYLGFTFLHETETSLHLIAQTFIVHYNLKTHATFEEVLHVPKVVATREDLLVCEDTIIQLTDTRSFILYKK